MESSQRISQTRHTICGTRPGGGQRNADFACRTGIALGHVRGALLVPHQDVLDLFLLEKLVVNRKHSAARIAKHMGHALVGQSLQHNLRTAHQFLGHNVLFNSVFSIAEFFQ